MSAAAFMGYQYYTTHYRLTLENIMENQSQFIKGMLAIFHEFYGNI